MKLFETLSEVAKNTTASGKRKKVFQGVREILTSGVVEQRLKDDEEVKNYNINKSKTFCKGRKNR